MGNPVTGKKGKEYLRSLSMGALPPTTFNIGSLPWWGKILESNQSVKMDLPIVSLPTPKKSPLIGGARLGNVSRKGLSMGFGVY